MSDKKTLLIESSPWGISFDKKNLKESMEIKEQGDTLILKGVPCTILDKKNQNGRNYGSAMMAKSINDAKDFINSRSALCQAHDHPEGSFVRPIDASHIVTRAYIEKVPNVGEVLFNDWEILPTSHGKDLAALIQSNVSLGTSIRGLGNMNGSFVEDYEFLGTDVVGNPSSGTFTKMFDKPVVVESVECKVPYSTTENNKSDLIVENSNETKLGDKEMVDVNISDSAKQIQHEGVEIAVTANPEPIKAAPMQAVNVQKEPANVAELDPADGKVIGTAPMVADAKKIGDQSYAQSDRANVLAREQNRLGDRCVELANMLKESRENLSSTAAKFQESQKLVNSLMNQLSVIHEALGGKDPNTFREEYENKLKEVKESADKNLADFIADKRTKTIQMAEALVEEATNKHAQLSESYEAKLSVKDTEIEKLQESLKESSMAKHLSEVQYTKDKMQMRRDHSKKLHEAVNKVSERSVDMNKRMMSEALNMVKMSMEEGTKIREELTHEIEQQKNLFESVSQYFEIACTLNDALSQALTEACQAGRKKHRKESLRRQLRGHR